MNKQKIFSLFGLAAVSVGSLGVFHAAAPANEIVVSEEDIAKATDSNVQKEPNKTTDVEETKTEVNLLSEEGEPETLADTGASDVTLHLYRFFAVGDDKDAEMYAKGYWGKQGISYRPIWTSANDDVSKRIYIEPNYFRTEDGKVAYCLEAGKPAPEHVNKDGKVSEETYRVLKAGYPFKSGSAYGVSDIELEWATTLAVKIVEGTAYDAEGNPAHQNKYELSDFGTNMLPVETDADGNKIPSEQHEKIRSVVEALVKAADGEDEIDHLELDASKATFTHEDNGGLVISNIKVDTNMDLSKLQVTVESKNNPEVKAVAAVSVNDNVLTLKLKDFKETGAVVIKATIPDATMVASDTYMPESNKEQKMYVVDTMDAEAEAETFVPNPETPVEGMGVIQIVKTGNNNGKSVRLKDVSFDVMDSAGAVVATITTDENGTAKTGNLPFGTYTIREKKTASGYALLKDDVTVVLAAQEGADNVTKEVKLENELTKVVILKVEKGTDKGLKGCELAVYDASGKVVVNATTDDNGNVTIMGLEPGTYQVGETKAPEGYKLNTSKISFNIDAYGNVSGTTTLEDEMTIVTLTKVDKADSSKKLSGATFEIRDANNNVVFTGSTDSYGKLTIGKMKPGTYKVRETKAPKGYQLSQEEITFSISDTGEVKGTTQMANEKTKVTITKQDKDDKKPLEGAVIGIKDANGKEVYSGKTNSEGQVVVEGLSSGKYTFYEKEAPNGYVKTSEVGSFTINENGEPVSGLIILNEKIKTTKTDAKKDDTTNGKSTNEKVKTGIEDGVNTSSMAVKAGIATVGVAIIAGAGIVAAKKKKTEE